MKKIFLFLAMACLALTACNDDDNGDTVTTDFLKDASWIEHKPIEGHRSVNFSDTQAMLTRADGVMMVFTYVISGNKLLFYASGTTGPIEHTVTKIDNNTIKISNIAISNPEELTDPQTVTFKRMEFTTNQ